MIDADNKPKSSPDYSFYTLTELTELLQIEKDYRANYELAQRVVANNVHAINYYIGVLSLPIINHIERTIIHRDILSEYYEFLSNPYNVESGLSEWRKVSLYKGKTCRLDSYTSLITTRHFCKIATKERQESQSKSDLIEYVDYQSLLSCASDDDESSYEVGSKLWKVRKAYRELCQRDQLALLCLTIEKMPALEAWTKLDPYIQPRPTQGMTSEEVKQTWSNKQKQDALSLIKGRAIQHFIRIFNQL